MPRQKKKTKIDFGDEDAVLVDVAKALLDADSEDMSIEEDRGMSGFGEGTVYRIEWEGEEYHVAENYDQAYALAVAVVKQDLEQEPEIFDKDFIESHINTDKLRDELMSDVIDHRIDDLTEMAENEKEDFWEEWKREGLKLPKEEREPTQNEIEELAQKQAETELEDPMQYLEDSVGREDAGKEAIRIAGIDINAAADDAVDTDGWEHFLARYDGHSHETASGLVYWRVN